MSDVAPAGYATEPAKKRNASEVVTALRRDIQQGVYAHNERLPAERQLADRFGIARGTLREALRQLSDLEYLERRAGSGTYVTHIPDDSTLSIVERTRPLELVDARFALEPHICRLAVLRATERDLQEIDAVLRKMEGSKGDIDLFADADDEFHTLLADMTGNTMIRWMMQQVIKVRTHAQWAQMRTMTLNGPMIEKYNAEHRAIYDAIRARDTELAAQRMKEHLGAAHGSLVAVTQT